MVAVVLPSWPSRCCRVGAWPSCGRGLNRTFRCHALVSLAPVSDGVTALLFVGRVAVVLPKPAAITSLLLLPEALLTVSTAYNCRRTFFVLLRNGALPPLPHRFAFSTHRHCRLMLGVYPSTCPFPRVFDHNAVAVTGLLVVAALAAEAALRLMAAGNGARGYVEIP